MGLVAPGWATKRSGHRRTCHERWPPVHPRSPSYGISFIKCRGGHWQLHRLAVFVSPLCGRVSSTWQLERANRRKSDLGLV